jgi:AraC family transcriptional regulator
MHKALGSSVSATYVRIAPRRINPFRERLMMTAPREPAFAPEPAGATTPPRIGQIDENNPILHFPGFRIENSRSWGPISADVVCREAGESVWQSDHHRIVYALTDFAGTISDHGPERPGMSREKLAYRPPGSAIRVNMPVPVRLIQILQSPHTYDNFACDLVRGGSVDLVPRAHVEDPLISRIVLTIANDIDGGFLDHILADALNTALAVQIMRQFVDPAAITLAPSNGLSRERLARIRDYVEAHLGDPLTLTEIAAVACLSPYHLSRSFKLTTGIGLHQYVVRRRIERAKHLLLRTELPLAEIAGIVGFDSQASFTARFRREIGVSPGRLRADRSPPAQF